MSSRKSSPEIGKSTPRFYQATEAEIRAGETTDVYFRRTVQIIDEAGLDRQVRAEFAVKSLPSGYSWGVFTGLEEVYALLDDLDLDIRGLPEGTIIRPYEPVLEISGSYRSFAVFETAILGLICQASGVATKAARIRWLAGDRILSSFGARRMHPSVAPVIERAAYIGGCDGVSVVKSADLLGQDPTGTTPHALMLLVGDTVEAMEMFDRIISPEANRIALVDTFLDEKFEAVRVADALGERLYGIRLDTPGSRRGDFARIIEEVRWELDLRGHDAIRIVVSGGLDEIEVDRLRDLVDAFGVGTSIANARTIDYGMDIVEIDGEPVAKRGKMSGAKQVWRNMETYQDTTLPLGRDPGDSKQRPMLVPLIESGQMSNRLPAVDEIRSYALEQLQIVGSEVRPQ